VWAPLPGASVTSSVAYQDVLLHAFIYAAQERLLPKKEPERFTLNQTVSLWYDLVNGSRKTTDLHDHPRAGDPPR
jgi:hypothetical protein